MVAADGEPSSPDVRTTTSSASPIASATVPACASARALPRVPIRRPLRVSVPGPVGAAAQRRDLGAGALGLGPGIEAEELAERGDLLIGV